MTTGESSVLFKVFRQREMTAEFAHEVLQWELPGETRQRARALLQQNRAGTLKPRQRRELDAINRVGLLLTTLQSRARKALGRRPPKSRRHD